MGKEPGSPNHVSAFNGDHGSAQPFYALPMASPNGLAIGLNDHDRDRIGQTASTEIIEELQRRLGMVDLDKTGVPYSMMDEELQKRFRQASQEPGSESSVTLGVPQSHNEIDTVYV